MSTYVYSEQQIDRILAAPGWLRVWLCAIGALMLLAAGLLAFFYLGFFAPHGLKRKGVIGVLVAFGSHLFLTNIRRRRSPGSERLRAILKKWSLEISPSAICFTGFRQQKTPFTREEITRAEEPSLGRALFLRTRKRYRYARIPRRLDDYEAVKREIILLGIPIEKTLFPPNLEELLLALLFIGVLTGGLVWAVAAVSLR